MPEFIETNRRWNVLQERWLRCIAREDWLRENPDDPEWKRDRDRASTTCCPRTGAALRDLLEWCGPEAWALITPHLPETGSI